MFTLATTNRFEKNLKKRIKRGKNKDKLNTFITLLMTSAALPPRYRDHLLTGNWKGFRECHIEPDWLLVYQINHEQLLLADTGTHADLF